MLPHIQRRDYQQKAVSVAREALAGGDIPCLTVPTGGGKTLIGCDIANLCINANPKHKVLIISNLSPLMSQWDESVLNFLGEEAYVKTDFLWGKKGRSKVTLNSKKIIIAMAQTIESRQWIPDDIRVVIWDEAHLSWFRHKCRNVIDELAPNASHVLLTATPYRLDGQEFGERVKILQVVNLITLIKEGYLAPFKAKRVGNFQIKSKNKSEEYTTAEIEQIIEKCSPAKVYEEWVKHEYNKMPTIGVVGSKSQAKIYCDYFAEQGRPGVVVTDETSEIARKQAYQQFREGKILLWSVVVLTIGFDEPCAQCLLLLRATKSPALLTQIVGRVLRTFKGNDYLPPKQEAYVLDFTGSMVSLGRPDEIDDWNNIQPQAGKECPNCHYVCGKNQPECPDCGYIFPKTETLPEDKEEKTTLVGEEEDDSYAWDGREMEDIPYLDKEAEPKEYYRQLLKRAYAAGSSPGKAYYEFKDNKKFLPAKEWSTHAVFGDNPHFEDAIKYLAYLRRVQSYSGKNEAWVWTQMASEFKEALSKEWIERLKNKVRVVLAG